MLFSLIINHIQADRLRILLATAMLLLVSRATGEPQETVSGPILDYQDTQLIIGSAAQVLLKQNTSNTLLGYCANKFKHLSQSAHTASNDWQQKHAKVISKAKAINRYVGKIIETHDSTFAAEKFQLKIDSQVYDSTQKFKDEMAIKSRKQQHYLCNRLILSTAMGEWDLVNTIPEHFQRVNEFKLKE